MSYDINYYKKYEPIFGSWKIEREIGEGSFGKVFEIKRENYGITYNAALKIITIPKSETEMRGILDNGMSEDSAKIYLRGIVDDVVREIAIMSSLKGHTNIVGYENHEVYPLEDGMGWDILIQMELLTPLNVYIKDHEISETDVITLGMDLCRALELCKKRHIIHRDIKPENIFLNRDGNYKLGDFGIARQIEKTQSGLTKTGTLTYMAPEIYRGEKYGDSVDIYSLGIVMYKLLNHNRAPFLPPFPNDITHKDVESAFTLRLEGKAFPAPDGTKSAELIGIILKACSFDPANRFENPTQMREALESLTAKELHGTVRARPPVVDETDENATVNVNGAKAAADTNTSDPNATYRVNRIENPAEEEPVNSNKKPKKAQKEKKPSKNGVLVKSVKIFLISAMLLSAVLFAIGRCTHCAHTDTLTEEGEKSYISALEWTREVKVLCSDCEEVLEVKTDSGIDECMHPQDKLEITSSDIIYDDIYNVKYHIDYTTTCTVCNEVVATKREDGKNECRHPETAVLTSDEMPTNDSELITVAYHTKKCLICDERLGETQAEYITHECTHPKDRYIVSESDREYRTAVKYHYYVTTRCGVKGCGATIGETETVYGKDDCDHSYNESEKTDGEKSYKNELEWSRTVTYTCPDCDAVTKEETETGKDPCKHTKTKKNYGEKVYSTALDWTRTVTEDCTIAVCGAKNVKSYTEKGKDECTHPTTKEEPEKNKNYHTDYVNWARNVHTVCTVCGKKLTVRVEYGKDDVLAYGTCGTNAVYVLDEGTLYIKGKGSIADYSDYDKTPWYKYRSSIKKVNIGNGITCIGKYSFSTLNYITDVTIPNSVTSIGYGAFWSCDKLSSVTIANSVKTIEEWAFAFSDSLSGITIPASVTSLGKWAFYDCPKLSAVTFKGNKTTIGDHAFKSSPKVVLYARKYSTAYYYSGDYKIPFAEIY